ncbi:MULTISPECIES: hypothetical protein [unclassified Nostoc]|uniref:Uncharacterized protein n=1 Tax=Nostoc punctiforme NIES-2108 TaxID=1356359 RepID=A0A367RBS6_NOSPU|nr:MULTISPECIES: hypothetical protein [unclassified Nostoc]MBN3877705.1 hypothetical protein [Nostoc sp. JL23]MBN3892683.1 hypothetical protein [Nostoc sp. JL31]RCJ33153.1 hypothetical protein A6769_25925 [Nostoc punctiforme NIES-2108]
MKTLRLLAIIPTALAMSLVFTEANLAQTPTIQINRNSQPDPLILNGKSGGTVKSNCGNITTEPNQVVQVTESLPYLRLTVESQGKPTLLIDGPGGRFCVLADSYSGGKSELSGYWQPGKYLLYVGELSPQQYTYSLSISQKNK